MALAATGSEAGNQYVDILKENQDEECGIYDDETKEGIRSMGLDVDALVNVPHRELFKRCSDRIAHVSKAVDLDAQTYETIAAPLTAAFFESCGGKGNAATSIAAMYFGSEYIVPQMYSQIYGCVSADRRLSIDDVAFFLLHMEMDTTHADHMREIVLAHCTDRAARVDMMEAVTSIMAARCKFFDIFIEKLNSD